MKSLALLTTSLFFSFAASATQYTIPAGPGMTNDQKTQIIDALRKFGVQNGQYISKDAAGEVCSLTVDNTIATLDFTSSNFGRFLMLEIPGIDYRQVLLDFSQTPETATAPATLHFAYMQAATERMNFIIDLNLTAQKGQLLSFQFGSAGPHGGSNIIRGEVYDSADFVQFPACSGLALH